MILVDIYVPAVGNTYDFQLDEGEKAGTLIEEIGELIGQKEHSRILGDINGFMLCSRKDKKILPGNMTLADSGVQNGDSLLLV